MPIRDGEDGVLLTAELDRDDASFEKELTRLERLITQKQKQLGFDVYVPFIQEEGSKVLIHIIPASTGGAEAKESEAAAQGPLVPSLRQALADPAAARSARALLGLDSEAAPDPRLKEAPKAELVAEFNKVRAGAIGRSMPRGRVGPRRGGAAGPAGRRPAGRKPR